MARRVQNGSGVWLFCRKRYDDRDVVVNDVTPGDIADLHIAHLGVLLEGDQRLASLRGGPREGGDEAE